MTGIHRVISRVTLLLYFCSQTFQGVIPVFDDGSNPKGFPGGHSLCPVVDCLPLMSYLQCDYKDTYVQTMELYGSVCPGCPLCRDYSYFQQLSRDITQQLNKAKDKVDYEIEVLRKNKLLIEHIQHMAGDDGTSGTGVEDANHLLANNLNQLQTILSDSGIVKAIRYMEENYKELSAILREGTFLEARLDRNIDGYFENTFSHVMLSFDDIPYYEQYRYDKILQDYNLDKTAQLQRQTDVIDSVVTNLLSQIENIAAITEEKYGGIKKSSPLMLRRLFQLLESNKGSLYVYLKNDMNGISRLTKALSKLASSELSESDKSVI